MRLTPLITAMLLSTAVAGSLAGPVRRHPAEPEGKGDDGLYPHQRRVIAALQEQNASELLARTPAKRHQPKRKAQRPNRAQRRAK